MFYFPSDLAELVDRLDLVRPNTVDQDGDDRAVFPGDYPPGDPDTFDQRVCTSSMSVGYEETGARDSRIAEGIWNW